MAKGVGGIGLSASGTGGDWMKSGQGCSVRKIQ